MGLRNPGRRCRENTIADISETDSEQGNSYVTVNESNYEFEEEVGDDNLNVSGKVNCSVRSS
jgi:hypothetical protein